MLEKLKSSLDRGIAAVGAKSESIVETSKTRLAINNAQKAMESELTNLGYKLYCDWKNGAVDLNTYAADLERIGQIDQDLGAYRSRLEQLKQEETRAAESRVAEPVSANPQPVPVNPQPTEAQAPVFCIRCGRQLAPGSHFCDGCGSRVD